MEKIVKILAIAFISCGGIISASTIHQSQNENNDAVQQGEIIQTNNSQQSNITSKQAKTIALEKISGTVKYEYNDDEYVFIIENNNTLNKVEIDKIHGYVDDIDTITYHNMITFDKAKEIALAKIDGTIIDIDFDEEYEFTLLKDQILYEIEIDGQSGTILKIEQENYQSAISLEEAKNIALNKINGTIKTTKEKDDEYKIFIEKDQIIYEIEINKANGHIEDIDKVKGEYLDF